MTKLIDPSFIWIQFGNVNLDESICWVRVKLKENKEWSIKCLIENGIFGKGSQISTNQKRKNSAFSLLISWNLWPFPGNTVLTYVLTYVKKFLNFLVNDLLRKIAFFVVASLRQSCNTTWSTLAKSEVYYTKAFSYTIQYYAKLH